jgi:hypothetical protein
MEARMSLRLVRRPLALTVLVSLAACGGVEEPGEGTADEVVVDELEPTVDGDFWSAGDADEPPQPGTDKADAILGPRALPTSADATSTAVWSVTRQWSAKVNVDFAPYFTKAEGLTWNEAYARFIEKLEPTTSVGGYRTYKLTNPWGKTLPIAALECAEQSMFLRVTFAAWFGLPFFLEAIDGSGTHVFAGHFGFRTKTGVYRNFPTFKTAYKDHTATAKLSSWPKDTALRARKLGSDDNQDGIAPGGKVFGTYLDELHANKRVGHFTMLVLLYFGSVNLAGAANTFHVKAEAVRAGDVLLERWQRAGIGHALNVKRVEKLPNGKLSVELASGSMPRRQALWEGPVTSRNYFLNNYTGGPGTNYDGVELATLGGGLRRWRVPVVHNGGWINTVPGDSAAAWINSSDKAAIAGRLAQFEQLLDVPNPAVRRSELSAALAAARQYQRERPASCSNREKRENLISELAALEAEDRYWSRAQSEQQYRAWEDYVFPLLAYDRAKVCCFNSSTAAMGRVAIDFNKERQMASRQCLPPVPFTAENMPTFKAWAQQNGRSGWLDWRADEPCPQSSVTTDQLASVTGQAAFCSLNPSLP